MSKLAKVDRYSNVQRIVDDACYRSGLAPLGAVFVGVLREQDVTRKELRKLEERRVKALESIASSLKARAR